MAAFMAINPIKALDMTSDTLFEGAGDDAARACIADRKLVRQFKGAERLPDADMHVIETLLDAVLTKRHLQTLIC